MAGQQLNEEQQALAIQLLIEITETIADNASPTVWEFGIYRGAKEILEYDRLYL